MNLKNIPFRLESELVQWKFRRSGRRPGSAPYLSADGFRELTPYRYEPGTVFEPSVVPDRGLVYCDGHVLVEFLKGPALQIPGRFSVLCHNSPLNVGPTILPLLPERMERLFTKNLMAADPRLVALPIGLENSRFHYNGVVRDFRKLQARPAPRINRVLVGFSEETNPAVRVPALEALRTWNQVDSMDRINSRSYRKLAARYRFIASPPGYGEDCHRTWEALYLRSVPIVIRSPLTEVIAARGIPLWLVDSYGELSGLDEDDLDRRYRQLAPGFDSPALWMPYWKDLIFRETREA